MGAVWDVEFYHARLSVMAGRGPVSAEEEDERRIRAEARRLELLTAPAPVAMMLEVEEPLDSYDPEQGFWLLSPEILQGTNVFLTLMNCDTNIGYDIYYTPALEDNLTWSILATGHIGQTTFTVPMLGWRGFYKGAEGGDWDGDGIPNWMDADPKSTNTGALTITIESPVSGALFQ
jgi:hypothetical protein